MVSGSEAASRLAPGIFLVRAILCAVAVNLILLGFILLRRSYRKRHFAKRDARLLELRHRWNALISGEIPYETWRSKPFDRQLVETIVLDAFEAAGHDEAARLLKFLRDSGLIEKLIFDARQHQGWRKNRALVALGRTRAPEGIPALAEALRDRNLETRLAAVRGLGRTGCPEAGQELLAWLAESGVNVPALPLQSALIDCCTERPRMLLPYLQSADKPVRDVLGRVLAETATAALGTELLQFVEDEQPELRAAAARALACADELLAVDVLAQLAQDPVWFVRLRAVVSLGKIRRPSAVPPLLRCVRDSNRLVRLRAAESLLDVNIDSVAILEQLVATGDRYALHAYLTALDNAGLQSKIAQQVEADIRISATTKRSLLTVLETGNLNGGNSVVKESSFARAAGQL
jgi:HEAT repeat protein